MSVASVKNVDVRTVMFVIKLLKGEIDDPVSLGLLTIMFKLFNLYSDYIDLTQSTVIR